MLPCFASAQVPAQRDSIAISKIDSLALALPDSARADTTREPSGLDAPIDFEAQKIDHDLDLRLTYLYGKAKVKYKGMRLEAGMITVDWNKRLLIAEPMPDSLMTNSQAKNGASKSVHDDSLMKSERGYPIFSDSGDRMTGERMEYNFATEKGRVLRGRTEFQDGKYFGAQIKRVDSQTLFVSNGIYSTCDREEDPHFHFWSRKMKIEVQKNVVAKPIVLFIGKIPMAILPFAFFPTQSGRRSGLIIPRFGATQLEGRYLRELGYYWAISDYFDARATVDYYERSGWLARGNFNYAKRYAFTGSISGSFTRKNFVIDQSKERRWDIAFGHSQTFGRSAYLNASGTFASSNFYRFFSSNRQEQLRRTLLSQATFSKSFGNSTSFSAAVSDYKNLDTGSFERLLPSFSISFGQRQLFGKRDPSKRTSGGKVDERHWYENFYYNLSSSAQNRYSKASDTSKVDRLSSAIHNMSLSLNGIKAFFPWLSLNQSMQITENWYDRATDYFIQPDGKVGSKTQKGFAALHVFSYNASTNTKIYGTFQPNLGPVRALRHVMEPSLGFSFRPDFSDPLWGYFQQVTLPDGTTQKLDRFNGATPRGKQASLNMSLRNLFQMKTGPDGKLKKIDLFTLTFFTSHNFAVSEFKQADLSSSLFANPTQNISFNMSASHSFYEYDEKLGRTVNRFLFKKNRGIFDNRYLRLTNINVGSSFRFQGKSGEAGARPSAESAEESEETLPGLARDRLAPETYFTDTTVPWQASFSLSLNHNRSNPAKPTTTAQLTLDNANLQLTKNWRVGLYAAFDLREKNMIDQRYTIFRDLHCWEMQFFWTPTGFSRGFYFRLGIKAPMLQDIKLEKRGGRTSVFGGSSYFY
ncbi:MAG: putative LPS assembly protein LptD [candidate division KSB1 bacterium]|nr:putative LPS assembly protein LptD [candidate division KSB1 bacterium]MDZ7368418.1 putative LPS assembly protein LptD [candidate division KSB1 bacterium]MDZ7406006.1 putative LPS assembly protein LptD [candidate division KSB1 bacterium]